MVTTRGALLTPTKPRPAEQKVKQKEKTTNPHFSNDQLQIFENFFKRNAFPTAEDHEELAMQCNNLKKEGVEDKNSFQVYLWFHRRRIKAKKRKEKINGFQSIANFTSYQTETMRDAYLNDLMTTAEQRQEIATKLNLKENQVFNWCRNGMQKKELPFKKLKINKTKPRNPRERRGLIRIIKRPRVANSRNRNFFTSPRRGSTPEASINPPTSVLSRRESPVRMVDKKKEHKRNPFILQEAEVEQNQEPTSEDTINRSDTDMDENVLEVEMMETEDDEQGDTMITNRDEENDERTESVFDVSMDIDRFQIVSNQQYRSDSHLDGLEPYLLLSNNRGENKCYMNTIANIIYSCSNLREMLMDCNLQGSLVDFNFGRIFRRETKSTTDLINIFSNQFPFGTQQDAAEVFEILAKKFGPIIRASFEFHKVQGEECRNCNTETIINSEPEQCATLFLPHDSTFETAFNATYFSEEARTDKICNHCGAKKVWETKRNIHVGSHLFVLVQRNGAKITDLCGGSIMKMFGSSYQLTGFSNYEQHSKFGRKGHYMAWVRDSGKWSCVSDDHLSVDKQKYVYLDELNVNVLTFEKIIGREEQKKREEQFQRYLDSVNGAKEHEDQNQTQENGSEMLCAGEKEQVLESPDNLITEEEEAEVENIESDHSGTDANLPDIDTELGDTGTCPDMEKVFGIGGINIKEKNEINVAQMMINTIKKKLNGNETHDMKLKIRMLPHYEKLLKLAPSRIHGTGLFSMARIEKETMFMEYTGEHITDAEADRRERENEAAGVTLNYMYRVGADNIIDASKFGSNARFMNHCCAPNVYQVDIENRIFFFTKKAIQKGEELTFDYQFDFEKEEKEKLKCTCGAAKCPGFMN